MLLKRHYGGASEHDVPVPPLVRTALVWGLFMVRATAAGLATHPGSVGQWGVTCPALREAALSDARPGPRFQAVALQLPRLPRWVLATPATL